jgi:hypothetical protein
MAASTEERVRKQIEFYLSSSNLMKDKFLRPIVQADPKGYVDVSMFANFPRVQSITRDSSLLVRALRQSSELKVNRDGTRVKRKDPFVEYDTEANTVYAVCTALPPPRLADLIQSIAGKFAAGLRPRCGT